MLEATSISFAVEITFLNKSYMYIGHLVFVSIFMYQKTFFYKVKELCNLKVYHASISVCVFRIQIRNGKKHRQFISSSLERKKCTVHET